MESNIYEIAWRISRRIEECGPFARVSEKDQLYLRLLLGALSDAEAESLAADPDMPDWPTLHFLKHRHDPPKSKGGFEVNHPLSLVLQWFSMPRSGKKTAARAELLRRFPALEIADQIRVFSAIMDSDTKADAEWVVSTMKGGFWALLEKECTPKQLAQLRKKVEDYCLARHEKYEVKRMAIECMSKDFVYANRSWLDTRITYCRLCQRLAGMPGFDIDRSRMEMWQYYHVLATSDASPECGSEDEIIEYISRVIEAYPTFNTDVTPSGYATTSADMLMRVRNKKRGGETDEDTNESSILDLAVVYFMAMSASKLGYRRVLEFIHFIDAYVHEEMEDKKSAVPYSSDVTLVDWVSRAAQALPLWEGQEEVLQHFVSRSRALSDMIIDFGLEIKPMDKK